MSQKLQCRVCGKDYTPCKSARYNPDAFNWREVSCSPDCGQVYLERVIASRTSANQAKPKRATKKRFAEDMVDTSEINI